MFNQYYSLAIVITIFLAFKECWKIIEANHYTGICFEFFLHENEYYFWIKSFRIILGCSLTIMFEHCINVACQYLIRKFIRSLLNQFLKHSMDVEGSFTVNCLFITFIKHSTWTFSGYIFLMIYKCYFQRFK